MFDPITQEELLQIKRLLVLGEIDKQLIIEKLKEEGTDVDEKEYDAAIKQFLQLEA